ncbi:MAG: flagellar hook-associated protein FlgK [SAR324 cluster bacterium]|nr:flagellar hook-associated protein FlgK [SAR324 cluster bacterium]
MSLFGNLHIGKSGLSAAQLGQSTTGHNISNANTKGFSRQRVEQSAESVLQDGKGSGVRIDGISRRYDQFNTEKLTAETANLEDWNTRLKYMRTLESTFQDLEGRGILDSLTKFWNAWSSVADQPENLVVRQNLVEVASQLTEQLSQLDQRLLTIKHDLTADMEHNLEALNGLTKELADLNKQIRRIEALRGNANDLKDQRDEIIREVSKIADVNWFHDKQGMIDVQLSAGVPLVRGVSAYDIKLYYDTKIAGFPVLGYELDEGNLINVTEQLTGGSLKGIIETRDTFIESQRQKLAELGKSLADSINNLHSGGIGIGKLTNQVVASSTIKTEEQTIPLNGLSDGEFNIKLVPHSKLEKELDFTISIDAGIDSLQDIIDRINETMKVASTRPVDQEIEVDQDSTVLPQTDEELNDSPNNEQSSAQFKQLLVADINDKGKLVLTASSGYNIMINGDSSQFLGKVGINSFFEEGTNLANFRVNPKLIEDPSLIALGYDQNPGDNRIALAVRDLQFTKLLQDKTATLDEYYRKIHHEVGLETKVVQQNQTNHQNIYDQYLALRDSLSGVNIDEEMTKMIKYQKAYDASAKYISTVDKMAETLINM